MPDSIYLNFVDIREDIELISFELRHNWDSNLTNFRRLRSKCLVVIKRFDYKSHLLAKCMSSGGGSTGRAYLRQYDAKYRRTLEFEFVGIYPASISLVAGSSKGKSLERVEFDYESHVDLSAVSLDSAARSFAQRD